MRYTYSLTSALLVGGAAISLITGQPAGAQVAQNDDSVMSNVVPRAGAPASFADLTEQLQPAVVNIATRQRVEVNRSRNPFAGTPLADLFNRRRGQEADPEPQTREAQSLGSGFIISADGYVVTNNHVIAPNDRATLEEITITMPDGTEYEAELVGADAASDLAVLKIQSNKTFPFVKFGNSAKARVGDWVVAIGNPFGLGGTVTSGIVSSVLRNTGGGAYDRYIQTDASINRGNSGGPLFDMQGNVIGINNAIYSPTGGSVGIGFAIPADIAAPIVEQLKAGRQIERGYLGVSIQPVDDDLADSLGLQRNRGEIVQLVQDGQPAAEAGIKAGDIVTAINGQAVTNEQTLSYLVANIAPGTKITVDLIRDGEKRRVNATVGSRPSEEELSRQQMFDPDAEADMPEEGTAAEEAVFEQLGVQLQELTPQIAGQLGVDSDTVGVLIGDVDRSSDAARKGLRRGDIILSANYQPVGNAEALNAEIAAAKEAGRNAIFLEIKSLNQRPRFLAVRFR